MKMRGGTFLFIHLIHLFFACYFFFFFFEAIDICLGSTKMEIATRKKTFFSKEK